MEIRRAQRADALAIATVHVRSWQAAYRGLLLQSYLDDLEPRRRLAQWETVLDATDWPSTGTLVLVDVPDASLIATGLDSEIDGASPPGVVAGFASISPSRDDDRDPTSVGELQTLYLDPRSWRRGGGSALLAAAQEELGRAGFRSASAWVLETNARARHFYEPGGGAWCQT